MRAVQGDIAAATTRVVQIFCGSRAAPPAGASGDDPRNPWVRRLSRWTSGFPSPSSRAFSARVCRRHLEAWLADLPPDTVSSSTNRVRLGKDRWRTPGAPCGPGYAQDHRRLRLLPHPRSSTRRSRSSPTRAPHHPDRARDFGGCLLAEGVIKVLTRAARESRSNSMALPSRSSMRLGHQLTEVHDGSSSRVLPTSC